MPNLNENRLLSSVNKFLFASSWIQFSLLLKQNFRWEDRWNSLLPFQTPISFAPTKYFLLAKRRGILSSWLREKKYRNAILGLWVIVINYKFSPALFVRHIWLLKSTKQKDMTCIIHNYSYERLTQQLCSILYSLILRRCGPENPWVYIEVKVKFNRNFYLTFIKLF